MRGTSTGYGYPFFALSVFLSAFLLFAIQPIAGKHLLPYFGGSSSVWATSLVFFTATLFAGYAYVYFVTSLRSRHQMLIHGIVIVGTMIATLLAVMTWGSIYPPLDWIQHSALAPALRVLVALSLSVGVPYFLLSTTGPLLQYWYGVSSEREPYKLYALSNAGSLLALALYPFVIEPLIALPREEIIWTALFFLYALLLVAVTISIRHIPPHVRAGSSETGTSLRKLEWIFFAAIPAFLLVSTTTVLTQLIAPVPLLWVIPLAIYLLTFIVAFSGYGQTVYMPLLVIIAGMWAYAYTPATPAEIVTQVSAYLFLLLCACLFFHARLYKLRPHTEALPFFYLCTSLGGVIGTICASLIAPMVFNNFYEFPLGLALVMSIAVVLLPIDFYPRITRERTVRMVRFVAPFVCAMLFVNLVVADVDTKKLPSRDFYGAVQLSFTDEATALQNGTTLHGLQPTAREWSFIPTTYYTQGSGIGRAIRYVREHAHDGPINVGVIGLGTGSAAVYCEKNDAFTFYEIDPEIEHIARSYFTYLARCAGSKVLIGDGRLTLAAQSKEDTSYDLFAVDAFTDDAIPAHLLTQEAVHLYMSRLANENSILAIHTSNRFLVLYPVLLSIARAEGLTAMVVNDNGNGGYLASASEWVLISKNPKVFDSPAFVGVAPWPAVNPLPPAWTDTYTSLFSVLDVPLPF